MEASTLPLSTPARPRIMSVDILRGLIMVIMALDHTRDFFSSYKGDPLDYEHASVLMFFTRWITHYCAPVFVFLAGASAFLSAGRGKTTREISMLLLTRGLWLIVLEVTIVRLGWTFNLDYHTVIFQVIWAIGWSMVFLSALVWLPFSAIGIIGGLIVLLHNALDGIKSKNTEYPVLWKIIHEQGVYMYGDHGFLGIFYPIIPWIGVMALGYCFGAVLVMPAEKRDRMLLTIGIGAIVAFIVLRASRLYGDMNPWQPQSTLRNSVLDFLRCQKYPPSLLYLFMTLGPAITIMPLLEKLGNTRLGNIFNVYGRVPMFYYILHIYLIHALALFTGLFMGFPAAEFTSNNSLFRHSTGWGFGLAGVYAYWLLAVVILYFPCRWFMKIKATTKKWWLSYI